MEFLSPNVQDFFSGGGSNKGQKLVKEATSEMLLQPDWGLNIGVSDYANNVPGGANEVAKAIEFRLDSSNPKVVLLSLHLMESVVKNGTFKAHAALGGKGSMLALERVARGKVPGEPQEKALELAQSFGQAFEGMQDTLPEYTATYRKLRDRGLQFPKNSSSGPVFTPPPSAAPAPTPQADFARGSTAAKPAAKRGDFPAELAKLKQDIKQVEARIAEAQALVSSGAVVGTPTPASLDLLDFLEQCKPRMVRVIEAVAQGALGDDEELFATSLDVNDRLCRSVDDLKRVCEGSDESDLLGLGASAAAGAAAVPVDGGAKPGALMAGGPEQVDDEDEFSEMALRSSRRKKRGNDTASSAPPPTAAMGAMSFDPFAAPAAAAAPPVAAAAPPVAAGSGPPGMTVKRAPAATTGAPSSGLLSGTESSANPFDSLMGAPSAAGPPSMPAPAAAQPTPAGGELDLDFLTSTK